MGEKDLDTLRSGFLLRLLFGSAMGKETSYELASRRAYRDLCRTLAVKGVPGAAKARERCAKAVAEGLREALAPAPLTWDGYAEKHQALCDELVGIYQAEAPACGFTYGHTQKWVNMAAKYLVVLGVREAESSIGALHVPIDSVVLKTVAMAKSEGGLGVESPFGKWTAINDYPAYLAYEESIRRSLGEGVLPLVWKFAV